MRTCHVWLTTAALVAVILAGCGSDGSFAPAPPSGGDAATTMEVGPMLVRPASTAGFTAANIPTRNSVCAFVALYGARINYLASQALLDRIAFASLRDGYWDIWVCNLDGSNMTQLTNNGAEERAPDWSPDGAKIAFARKWSGQDWEIMTMAADGSTIRTRTTNTAADEYPSWSPDSRAIAYHSDITGNFEIYRMYEDGASPLNLTNLGSMDKFPDWSPIFNDPDIAFMTNRDGGALEIYRMEGDGTSPVRLTTDSRNDYAPAWNSWGSRIAWQGWAAGNYDIFDMNASGGGTERNVSNHSDNDRFPAFSSDNRWMVFTSNRAGNKDIWLQETDEPYRAYQVTTHASPDNYPHLGGPVMQVERVLVGPPGSDWGGFDPVWSSAYAGVVAFDGEGYRNFVRIGIAAAHLGSLQITPMDETGMVLAGVVVEATEIVNLREDAGRGLAPTIWQLDPLNAGAVLLYFDANAGKLTSVLAVRDVAYPSAAGSAADAVRQRTEGGRLVVAGDFAAVFDAEGRNVAPGGATHVALDRDGKATVLQ